MVSTNANPSDSKDSLHSRINNGLHQAIFEDSEADPATALLYDLTYGNTTPRLAAAELIAATRKTEDAASYFSSLSTQTVFLACEYPFLQPQLVSLVACIMQSPPLSFSAERRSEFVSEMVVTIGDTTQSNYGNIFDERHRTPDVISDHIHLNRFIARLLSALGDVENPEERITGLDDALFILSTGLEDNSESHNLPDVDIPAAAQYMIHAGELFFEACKRGTGQALAPTPPLWATRGKLWTGQPGLSRSRWDFWKTRFEAAAGEPGNTSAETRKIARLAERAMGLLKGGGRGCSFARGGGF